MADQFAAPFVDVPIRLEDVDSVLAGRIAFVVNNGDLKKFRNSANENAGANLFTGDLFGRGVQALFRNYLAGRDVGNGLAALTDDQGFLRAVRRLTDRIYAYFSGAGTVIDVSPGNARVAEVISAVYPEATILRTPAEAAAWAPPTTPVFLPTPDPLAYRPIFIVGVPRSGTTWLENMLLAHPGILGPRAETSIFVSLRALWANGLPGWMPPDELASALHLFVGGLFGDWLARAGQPEARFLDKTPMHAEHLPLIGEVFRDAAIIAVHRDGRDVVHSLLEMDAATDDVVVAATAWRDITRAVSAAVPSLPLARDEQYEDLLRDPAGGVIELLSWLGLGVDAATTQEVRRRAGERVSQYNTTGDVGPGKWTSLSDRELRAVYEHAGTRLVELGYVDAGELPRRRWWRR